MDIFRFPEYMEKNKPAGLAMFDMTYCGTKGIFIFGGKDEKNKPLNELWEYNIKTKTWKIFNPKESPDKRYAHKIVCLKENYIILFGGKNTGDDMEDTWMYDIKEGAWTRVFSRKSPSARSRFGMTAIDSNKLLLYGLSYFEEDEDDFSYSLGSDSQDIWIFELKK